jgi:regulator of replication initiation timing
MFFIVVIMVFYITFVLYDHDKIVRKLNEEIKTARGETDKLYESYKMVIEENRQLRYEIAVIRGAK